MASRFGSLLSLYHVSWRAIAFILHFFLSWYVFTGLHWGFGWLYSPEVTRRALASSPISSNNLVFFNSKFRSISLSISWQTQKCPLLGFLDNNVHVKKIERMLYSASDLTTSLTTSASGIANHHHTTLVLTHLSRSFTAALQQIRHILTTRLC